MSSIKGTINSFRPVSSIDSNSIFNERNNGSTNFRNLLKEAIKMKASDMHVERNMSGGYVRARVDGSLAVINERMAKEDIVETISSIKRISKMDESTVEVCQDGAFSLNINDTNYRFRVALSPTVHGEEVVIRIIYDEQTLNLEEMNYSEEFVSIAKRSITKSYGLIVVTGPTGSGKSTLLQAMISEVNSYDTKIISIENPVERIIPNVTQKSISQKLSWSDAIRSSLREDPDVIYVGEVRDRESAMLVIEAAKTGHLVVTTVHANDPIQAVDRFHTFGIEKSDLSSVLRLVTAQRLLKTKESRTDIPSRIPAISFNEYKNGSISYFSPTLDESLESFYQEGIIDEREKDKWQS